MGGPPPKSRTCGYPGTAVTVTIPGGGVHRLRSQEATPITQFSGENCFSVGGAHPTFRLLGFSGGPCPPYLPSRRGRRSHTNPAGARGRVVCGAKRIWSLYPPWVREGLSPGFPLYPRPKARPWSPLSMTPSRPGVTPLQSRPPCRKSPNRSWKPLPHKPGWRRRQAGL